MSEVDAADEIPEGRRVVQRRWRWLEVGPHVFEAGLAQAARGRFRIGVVPRLLPIQEERLEPGQGHQTARSLVPLPKIPASSALRQKKPARAQRGQQALEQAAVVLHPMKSRGAEDAIGDLIQRQVLEGTLQQRESV